VANSRVALNHMKLFVIMAETSGAIIHIYILESSLTRLKNYRAAIKLLR